jgi:multimeric flavodoxin WrbA
MQAVHRDLRAATHVVLATPVFFMGPTAQVKAMIDRCQALWVLKYKLGRKIALDPAAPRRGLLLAAGGSHMKNLFEPTMAIVKSWLLVLDFFYTGEVTAGGVDGPGAVKDQPTALAAAWTSGQKLLG